MAEEDTPANAPLIERDSQENSDQHETSEGSTLSADAAPTKFIWALTLTAAISGLLFGYDTGVISSTLVSIGSDLSRRPLTTLDESLVVSCTSFFALIASPVAGSLADRLGRKWVIGIADALFIIGAQWQALTGTVWGMIVGRSVVGLAIGGASLVVPLYISELSPSAHRGRLVTLSVLLVTLGQVIAYLVGWWLSSTHHGWRWMVGIGSGPAIVQFGLLFFMPETPRWLMKVRDTDDARHVLSRVYGKNSEAVVEALLRAIDMEILSEEEAPTKNGSSWLAKIRSRSSDLFEVGGHRRALVIACLLQGLQQLCGFNSLMYFSATIFSQLRFSSPTLASLSIAVTNLIFTLVAMVCIDRVGRRRVLLYSIPIMVLALFTVALAFAFFDQNAPASTKSPTAIDNAKGPWAYLILVSMVIYVSSYAIGMGNVPWQQSELFPLSIRSLGSSIATATNWGSNFIVGLTFLPMMQLLSPTWTFITYAFVCMAGWGCIWKIYPETMGLGLEEVGALLSDGWGVKESLQRL